MIPARVLIPGLTTHDKLQGIIPGDPPGPSLCGHRWRLVDTIGKTLTPGTRILTPDVAIPPTDSVGGVTRGGAFL